MRKLLATMKEIKTTLPTILCYTLPLHYMESGYFMGIFIYKNK